MRANSLVRSVGTQLPGSSYNLGYTDILTNTSICYQRYLASGEGFTLNNENGTAKNIGVRASTNSTPGTCYMQVGYLTN